MAYGKAESILHPENSVSPKGSKRQPISLQQTRFGDLNPKIMVI